MAKVQVVTAYVDLGLTKRPSAEFNEQGYRLHHACAGRIRVFDGFPYQRCWLAQEVHYEVPAANPRAEDRFATDTEHVRSNILQHSPIQWLRDAYDMDPDVDVFVWLGYSLLKQGDFTGKRITEEHVVRFLDRLEHWTPDHLPFPGIAGRGPINVHGDNWRFCGSTLIVPRQFLPQVERSYKFNAREFVRRHHCVPLDLAIWPAVEDNSGLPWRQYQAEYDHTQLSNFG